MFRSDRTDVAQASTVCALSEGSFVSLCVEFAHKWIIFQSYRDLSSYYPTPSTH